MLSVYVAAANSRPSAVRLTLSISNNGGPDGLCLCCHCRPHFLTSFSFFFTSCCDHGRTTFPHLSCHSSHADAYLHMEPPVRHCRCCTDLLEDTTPTIPTLDPSCIVLHIKVAQKYHVLFPVALPRLTRPDTFCFLRSKYLFGLPSPSTPCLPVSELFLISAHISPAPYGRKREQWRQWLVTLPTWCWSYAAASP